MPGEVTAFCPSKTANNVTDLSQEGRSHLLGLLEFADGQLGRFRVGVDHPLDAGDPVGPNNGCRLLGQAPGLRAPMSGRSM
jgi:hypothetical protein